MLHDASGADDAALTAAEKARRERAREQAGGVVTYVATPDLAAVYFVLGGSLHCIDTDTGVRRELACAADAFDPRPEPGSDRVAYVSGASLRLSTGSTDREIPGLESSDTVSWGSAEFVAAEEMGRGRGFWWAPTGQQMAVARVDTSPVPEWWIAAPDRPGTAPRPIRYPAAGADNAHVELWIVDVDDGPVRRVDWSQGGSLEYLCDVLWGERLLIVGQPRDQRSTVVLEADPDDGTTREIARVDDEHWTELFPGLPIDSGAGLLMIVDDADTDTRRLARDGTPFSPVGLNVRSVVAHDDEGCLVTATRSGIDSIIVHIGWDGTVTERSEAGLYSSASARGGTMVTSSAYPADDSTHVISWHDGTTTHVESFAEAPGFEIAPFFTSAGPRSCNAAVCVPSGHDGSPLPVLLDPYGGPHAQRVLTARNAFATSQWFAEQGFAVVVIDGRGTPGRGPAFERTVYGDLAGPVLDDQIETLQDLAARDERLDLSAVGIRGWSFGGYLAALAVLRRPDAVHAAVAGAPVTDWRLYDTHYTERYLGHPDEVPEHYAQTDLIADAHRLERPLMLIHGLADDNVVAAHTLGLSHALLAHGKPHTVLPLSGVTHMTPQEQVAENLLHLQRDFLLEHLGAGDGAPDS